MALTTCLPFFLLLFQSHRENCITYILKMTFDHIHTWHYYHQCLSRELSKIHKRRSSATTLDKKCIRHDVVCRPYTFTRSWPVSFQVKIPWKYIIREFKRTTTLSSILISSRQSFYVNKFSKTKTCWYFICTCNY